MEQEASILRLGEDVESDKRIKESRVRRESFKHISCSNVSREEEKHKTKYKQ